MSFHHAPQVKELQHEIGRKTAALHKVQALSEPLLPHEDKECVTSIITEHLEALQGARLYDTQLRVLQLSDALATAKVELEDSERELCKLLQREKLREGA